MWASSLTLLIVLKIISSEVTVPGIDRRVSDGVTSLGYKVIYGDDDIEAFNEVFDNMEKSALKQKKKDTNNIQPLPAQDVKCLMSVDRYCSKEMGAIKSVLIQALKDDCKTCSDKQKDETGRVIASMMAHDPVAWKIFLTRYDGLNRVERVVGEVV